MAEELERAQHGCFAKVSATRDVKRAPSNPGDKSGHVAGVGCWGVGLGYGGCQIC